MAYSITAIWVDTFERALLRWAIPPPVYGYFYKGK
jgi:hypothetical protein